jgi:phosphohistidine phosphatase
MPRLLIVRHAKAVAHDREDFERPLAERGRTDAQRMGLWIARRGLAPDAIIHSGAARTKETAAILAAQWPAGTEIAEDRGLYEASPQGVFDLIRGLSDASASAAIVGHNPAIAKVATLLAGSGSREERTRMAAKFPPGAVAVIEFAGRRWRQVAPDAGALIHFTTPSELASSSD